MGRLLDSPANSRLEVSNTLAYYDLELITAVKSFIVSTFVHQMTAPRVINFWGYIVKLFTDVIYGFL
jgi:hypothetical protein